MRSHPDGHRHAAARHFTKRAHAVLNVLLFAITIWMVSSGRTRATYLLGLVPLIFVPYSFSRVRMYDSVAAHLTAPLTWAFAIAALLLDAVMILQLLGARSVAGVDLLQGPWASWVGPVWFSTHSLWLWGYLILHFSRRGARRMRSLVTKPKPEAAGIERRELFRRAGLAGAALPLGVSVSSAPLSYDFRIVEREVHLENWPASLDGLRVVHLSDIHVGGEMNASRLAYVAELANRCKPEIVIHTGDFLTHRTGDFDLPLYEALARIEAPHGQWACLGNHDYDNPQRIVSKLSEAGVTVLRDRLARVPVRNEAIDIAGFDYRFARSSRAAAYRELVAGWGPRSERPRLLLNHDPTAFADLPERCADLVFSGHTHGGHIGLQLGNEFAITLVGLAGYPDQGIFERDGMKLHVTRCVGFYGYPMRIGIPPEIALVTIRTAGRV